MRQTTAEKLAHTRAGIVRWERKLRRAGNALQRLRQREARQVRAMTAETRKEAAPVAKPRQPKRKNHAGLTDRHNPEACSGNPGGA